MADKYQTQCPHCGVKFQITDQQLALANGTVRCGSCLQVFQASQNLVPLKEAPPSGVGSARAPARPAAPPPPAAKPAAPARPPRPAPAPPAEDVDGDELADKILKEIEESAAAARAARTAPAQPPAPPAAPAAPAPRASAPATPAVPAAPPAPRPPAPTVAIPEPQWAPAPPPAAKAGATSAERYGIEENKLRISIGGNAVDKSLIEGDDPFGASANTLLDEVDEPVDESWAKELLGERPLDDKEERVRKFTQIKADDLAMATTGVQSRSALEEQINRLAGAEAPAMAPPLQRSGAAGDLEDELDFLNEPGITMQDVELPGLDSDIELGGSSEVHTVSWGRDAFWGTLSAVFALALFAQYLVFNFDTLARDDDWRGVYEAACGAIGCTLPGSSDVARIHGANLVIRSHPKAAQALVVDAIVYNRAPFAQPYPRLELSFSDMQGNPVAGRVFSAAEYLKGEVAATDLMPPDTPVHLTLELVDPGAQAVNYELRFLPPDAS